MFSGIVQSYSHLAWRHINGIFVCGSYNRISNRVITSENVTVLAHGQRLMTLYLTCIESG